MNVLVVDDIDANRRLVQALLREFGHLSEVAACGLEAVEMAAPGRFDVVLMEQLPDIDGMAPRGASASGWAPPRPASSQ